MKRIKLFGKEMWLMSKEERNTLRIEVEQLNDSSRILIEQLHLASLYVKVNAEVDTEEDNEMVIDEDVEAYGSEIAYSSMLEDIAKENRANNKRTFGIIMKILGEA